MRQRLPALLCGLSLFIAASAFAQFPSTKSAVEPRGPGGLDAPSKQVDMVPPASAAPAPAPQSPQNVDGKSLSPINPPSTPASRTGY